MHAPSAACNACCSSLALLTSSRPHLDVYVNFFFLTNRSKLDYLRRHRVATRDRPPLPAEPTAPVRSTATAQPLGRQTSKGGVTYAESRSIDGLASSSGQGAAYDDADGKYTKRASSSSVWGRVMALAHRIGTTPATLPVTVKCAPHRSRAQNVCAVRSCCCLWDSGRVRLLRHVHCGCVAPHVYSMCSLPRMSRLPAMARAARLADCEIGSRLN